jgi:hypothetical protein
MIGIKESGPVQDIITQDAFEIHDIMFNFRDVIQCLFCVVSLCMIASTRISAIFYCNN